MNRRTFFRTMVRGAAGVAVAPYVQPLLALLPAPASFGNRFIQSAVYIPPPQRYLMARIRITGEAMRAYTGGAFAQAARDEWAALARDMESRNL